MSDTRVLPTPRSVALARGQGAKSAREAAELAARRPLTPDEWYVDGGEWDRLWAAGSASTAAINPPAKSLSLPKKLALWISGFVCFAGAAFVAELLLFALINSGNYHFTPRGAGWAFVPISLGLLGARFFQAEMPGLIARAAVKGGGYYSSRLGRITVAAIACWLVCVCAFVFIFEPFGTYMYANDWAYFWKILIAPPVVFLVCQFILVKTLSPAR